MMIVALALVCSSGPLVSTMRVPNGGIQPQIIQEPSGRLDLVYFKGAAAGGDLFYIHSEDEGADWSEPVRVNSIPGSAVAIGNIRGAQIALGRNGRVHAVWNGASQGSPLYFARLSSSGDAFEAQKPVSIPTDDLDGGGSVAADAEGNVYAVWHGHGSKGGNEQTRQVWMAKSTDDGETFSAPRPVWNRPTGACGCCSLKAYATPDGKLWIAYRAATNGTDRGAYLISSDRKGSSFSGEKVSEWTLNTCPMSTFCLTGSGPDVGVENRGFVLFGFGGSPLFQPEGQDGTSKFPFVVQNAQGVRLAVWTGGMGWQRGGSVHWQEFDPRGNVIAGSAGKREGVPVWSLVSAYTKKDGSFVVVY